MNNLIKEIKQKKELSDLPDSFIIKILNSYIKKYKINLKYLKSKKQKKLIVKDIRKELRNYVGRFQVKYNYKGRAKLLKENKIEKLLKTHSSTKERLENYNQRNQFIYQPNPKSILDLACGLNPLAIAKQGVLYYAIDIKKDELNLIEIFFKKNKINGKTILADITKIKEFPKADICLIFKTLDIIEKKSHKKAKEIIEKLKCKSIVVSFSTKTLSGKPMSSPRRLWFENLINSLNLNFEIRRINNEVFYFVAK